MDYLRICKKGLNMVKKNKRSNDNMLSIKKIEEMFCLIILIIFIVLLVSTFKKVMFLPATLIMGALECFALGYSFREEKEKINIIYILFGIGMILLVISVVYTILNVR